MIKMMVVELCKKWKCKQLKGDTCMHFGKKVEDLRRYACVKKQKLYDFSRDLDATRMYDPSRRKK